MKARKQIKDRLETYNNRINFLNELLGKYEKGFDKKPTVKIEEIDSHYECIIPLIKEKNIWELLVIELEWVLKNER